jgi:hypothetical protein
MTILLDMDGVLTDWRGGVLKLAGRSRKEEAVKAAEIDGSFAAFEGLVGGRDAIHNMVEHAGIDFWKNLDKLPGADLLVNTLLQLPHQLLICTSPGSWPIAAAGKIEYLHRHWPGLDFCICKSKHKLASPHKLLIDDHKPWIDNFMGLGGHAFYWPDTDLLYGNKEIGLVISELKLKIHLAQFAEESYQPR